jgi:GntR family transcriptional repressor for pyruvate dehydrogenase complex
MTFLMDLGRDMAERADLIMKLPDVAASMPVRGTRIDEWAPVSRVRTYELVLQRIEAQIVSGALRAGEKLPPERQLAELFSVSRPAVREALRVLEAQGVVRSQVGQGSGSGTTIDRVPSDALSRLLRLHVALGSFPLEDVVETRVALERSIVVLACRNARPQNLARIRAAMLAMDEALVDRETFNQLDIDFHVAMAEAGGNRLMSDVTRAIRESVRIPFLAAVTAMPETGEHGWPRIRDGLRADHHAVLTALEAGQGEQAADLLETHIRGFYANVITAP